MRKLLLASLVACILSPGSVAYGAGQVACWRVISELNKVRKAEDNDVLAMEKVAKRLRTRPIWVENCMRVYGRAVPRRIRIDQDLRDETLERMEEQDIQPEDQAPEELREPDPRLEYEAETAGTRKRPNNEHIRTYRYLPQ